MKIFFVLLPLYSIAIEPRTSATRLKKVARENHIASSSDVALAPPPQQQTQSLPTFSTSIVAGAIVASNLLPNLLPESARIASTSGRQLELVSADRGLPFDLNKDPPLNTMHVDEVPPTSEEKPLHEIETSSRRRGSKATGTSTRTDIYLRKEREGEVRKTCRTQNAETEKEERAPGIDRGESSSTTLTTSNERAIKPFYLKNLPSTKVGELFHAFEVRYWEARQGGQMPNLGKHLKFFITPKDQGLTIKERNEFRKLAKRFTDRLSERTPGKHKAIVAYQHRRFGRGVVEKTEAQLRATKRRSQRTYLMSRLKKILASLTANEGEKVAKVEWKATYDEMLQDIVAETPLKPGDMLLELYKKMIELKQIPSCIQLPP